MKEYIVRLTAEEQARLSQMIRSGKAATRALLHAWSDEVISEALQVHATAAIAGRVRVNPPARLCGP